MSVLTRPLLHPQQREDLEDFNLGLSALRADSHFYTKRFISPESFILQGFTISQAFIGQPTADVVLTNATLINGNNTGDISWWTAPDSASPLTLPIGVGGLQSGRNYVELEVYAQDGTPLQRAFWDPTANSGKGIEFTQEVNTVTELLIRAKINQTGFTGGNPNLIPLAIIDLDGSNNIKGIRDKRSLLFRSGKGDNINASYTWGTQTEPATTLTFTSPSGTPFVSGETVTFTSGATAEVVVGGTNNITVFNFSTDNLNPADAVSGGTSGATATLQSYYEAFTGADKDIKNYRDMFSALMTSIKTLKGTNYWYEVGNAISLISVLNLLSAILTPIASGARFSWSGTALTLTDNATSGQALSDVMAAVRVPGFSGNLYLTRQDGTGGSTSLSIPDKSILYVELPTLGTSRTYSQSGSGTTNFRVVDIADFVPTDKNYILGYREGAKVIITGLGELKAGEAVDVGNEISKETLAFIGAENDTSTSPQYTSLPDANLSNQFTTNDSLTQAISINTANINDIADAVIIAYEEPLTVVSGAPANDNEVTGPVLSGATLTLPLDSRKSNVQGKYRVGAGGLIVTLNGQMLTLNTDYTEVGSSSSLSSTIIILQDLVVGDQLDIRFVNPQIIGTAGDDQAYFVNYLVGQNGSQIPVGALYNTGTERLQVWRNGLAMLRTSSLGDLIDRYQEANTNSITVSQVANPDEVFAMVNHAAPSPAVTLITGVSGTVLTIPTYVIGNGALRIFRNGVLLSANAGAPTDLKYSETSTSTITLALAASTSDVFKVFKAGTPPQFREVVTGITGLTVSLINTYTLGDKKLLVFRNGLLMSDSTSIGTAETRYQEASTSSITLEVAAVTSDLFEFINV